MKHFYENLGERWFTFPLLYSSMVEKFPDESHFVEVGVWKGMSASYMAVEIINSGKKIRFDAVDTWEYVPGQEDIPESSYSNLFETFLKNISPVKDVINPVKKFSIDAAGDYKDGSLDFFFIDASHDYKNLTNDINAWYPKVKSGGIIAGHDYAWSNSVKKAVDDFFNPANLYPSEQEGCWIVIKP